MAKRISLLVIVPSLHGTCRLNYVYQSTDVAMFHLCENHCSRLQRYELEMNDHDYLVSKGWKLVRKVTSYSPALGHRTNWQAWEHPDHQSDRRGFFQKSEALVHQKELDKGAKCNCIAREKN